MTASEKNLESLRGELAWVKERRNAIEPSDPMWNYWDGQAMALSYCIGLFSPPKITVVQVVGVN